MWSNYQSFIETVPFSGANPVYSQTYDVPSFINLGCIIDITYTVGSAAVIVLQYSNDGITWTNSSAITSASVAVWYYRYCRMRITPTACEGSVKLTLTFKR